jgi:hypothetical protein
MASLDLSTTTLISLGVSLMLSKWRHSLSHIVDLLISHIVESLISMERMSHYLSNLAKKKITQEE